MCNGCTFQVSNCLWTLDVTLFVIDMKHADKRNGKFCCCDEKMDNMCEDNLHNLGTCAEGKCDLLLSVTVSPCTESTSPGPCSVSTDEIKKAENILGDYGLCFHFTTTEKANNVRKCSCIYSIYVCACVCVYCVCIVVLLHTQNEHELKDREQKWSNP